MSETVNPLEYDFYNLKTEQLALAEGFLYRYKVHMLYADPGVGKSTLTQQLSLELSSGRPVFGSLAVSQPFKVYYLQLEGDMEETIERMRLMSGYETDKFQKPNFDNLYWDNSHVGLNVMDQGQVIALARDIMKKMPDCDLVIIDPIYQAIVGDISKPEVATGYCRFSSMLQTMLNCAILHVHHTPKQQVNKDGESVDRETFYGSQWFAAHMNSMYYLKQMDKKNGKSILYNKKQRNSNNMAEILLTYDIETHSVYIEDDLTNMTGHERVVHYLRECKKTDFKPSLYQIKDAVKLSHAYVRHVNEQLFKSGMLTSHKMKSGLKLYEILG